MTEEITVEQYLELKRELLKRTTKGCEKELGTVSEALLNYFKATSSNTASFSMELGYKEGEETKLRKLTFFMREEKI